MFPLGAKQRFVCVPPDSHVEHGGVLRRDRGCRRGQTHGAAHGIRHRDRALGTQRKFRAPWRAATGREFCYAARGGHRITAGEFVEPRRGSNFASLNPRRMPATFVVCAATSSTSLCQVPGFPVGDKMLRVIGMLCLIASRATAAVVQHLSKTAHFCVVGRPISAPKGTLAISLKFEAKYVQNAV